jgi:hypothetical protein
MKRLERLKLQPAGSASRHAGKAQSNRIDS